MQDGDAREELSYGRCCRNRVRVGKREEGRGWVDYVGGGLTKRENAQRKTNSVVFKRSEEESPIGKEPPDEDVSDNTGRQIMRPDRKSTNPIKRHEIPRQGPRNDANVKQARRRRMSEIQNGQIEEIDDE